MEILNKNLVTLKLIINKFNIMSSKFFGNKHESTNGSRRKQNKGTQGGNRTNNKRNSGVKKSGRGR